MSDKIYTSSKDVSMLETEHIRLGREYDKLKDELEQVKGERDAMREALEPFAEVAQYISDDTPGHLSFFVVNQFTGRPLCVSDIRKAAAALKDAK